MRGIRLSEMITSIKLKCPLYMFWGQSDHSTVQHKANKHPPCELSVSQYEMKTPKKNSVRFNMSYGATVGASAANSNLI